MAGAISRAKALEPEASSSDPTIANCTTSLPVVPEIANRKLRRRRPSEQAILQGAICESQFAIECCGIDVILRPSTIAPARGLEARRRRSSIVLIALGGGALAPSQWKSKLKSD
jgi:hypothetical protein